MAEQIDVLAIGEALGCLRTNQFLQVGSALHASIAGAETNVAIGLARLGHTVRWAGVVGRDHFGDLILRTLRAEGVKISARRANSPTGIIMFTERLPGVTIVDYFRNAAAGATLCRDDVDVAFETPPRVLHVTGITPALSPEARSAIEHAADRAREAGSSICLDINYRSRLWSREDARVILAPLTQRADIVIASDDEVDLALATPPHKQRDQIAALADLVGELVVKHGDEGATAYTRDGTNHEPARRIRVVDTVGAGDAFVAGYLSARLDGLSVPDRLARGATLGAFAVANAGDWEGLPRKDELGLLELETGTAVR